MFLVIRIFFFSSRRRHTRCGRDWSSDVCSSDLRSFFAWLSSSFQRFSEFLSHCELHEGIQRAPRRIVANGLGGKVCAVQKILCCASGDEGGSGVDDDHVARCAALVGEDAADERGVFRGIAAAERCNRRSAHTELFRTNRIASHTALLHVSDERLTGERDFIQPVRAMHDKGSRYSESSKRGGDQIYRVG